MRLGFFGALALLFIGLKLCSVVAWSWWWVLAPLWIPAAVLLAIPVATFLAAGVMIVGALLVGMVLGACGWKPKPKTPRALTREEINRAFYGRKRR